MAGLFGIGGSAAKTDRKTQLQSWQNLQNLFSQTAGPGVEQIGKGAKGLSTARNYFEALMSGDPAKMSAVLAPQISTIQGQTGQQVASIGQFAGRSGGTAEQQLSLESEAARSIQSLFDVLGPEAAREVAQISGIQEELGLSEAGLAESATATAGQQATGARETDVPVQQAQQAAVMEALTSLAGFA